jgi:serine protease AprX
MADPKQRPALRSVAWTRARSLVAVLTLGAGLAALAGTSAGSSTGKTSGTFGAAGRTGRYIVVGTTTSAAAAGVGRAHGTVLAELPGVKAVVAVLTPAQQVAVERAGLELFPDATVTLDGTGLPSTSHPSVAFNQVTGASSMWASGANGAGVTVAVLDTGIDRLPDFGSRLIGGVDLVDAPSALSTSSISNNWSHDGYGHGTFVAGLIASDGTSSNGQYTGVAPGADLVAIKVAGSTGLTNEGTVIEGVEWAISHRSTYGIRVLNLSLGTEPLSPSALDPLDQEVEEAWNAGIVVVTSAGNQGPGNGTITSPGNDPLVITVGALNDGGADAPSGFSIPTFSSVGPTLFDGWFKPDLVAPGSSVISLDAPGSLIDALNPQARIGTANFVGSGTSFSAAIVSGLAALLLQEYPWLTPNQVKAALLLGASAGPVGDPFVDGHGEADAPGAAAVAGQVDLDQWPAADAESSNPPSVLPLSASWSVSTWNPANWSGAAWNASAQAAASQTPASVTVTGAAWNGAAWNGAAWNGAAWNGAAWNGAAWNGAAWNGAAWNGAAWNGAAWNGAAWNSVAFDAGNWG